MADINQLECCAVAELDGIQDSTLSRTLRDIYEDWFIEEVFNGRFIVFTDNDSCEDGDELRDYIKKHNLGTVVVTRKAVNPNSGNYVKVYVWTVNIPKFKGHVEKLVPYLKSYD